MLTPSRLAGYDLQYSFSKTHVIEHNGGGLTANVLGFNILCTVAGNKLLLQILYPQYYTHKHGHTCASLPVIAYDQISIFSIIIH
jgi:hypothetical protein